MDRYAFPRGMEHGGRNMLAENSVVGNTLNLRHLVNILVENSIHSWKTTGLTTKTWESSKDSNSEPDFAQGAYGTRAECRNLRKANILEKLIRQTEAATENGKRGMWGYCSQGKNVKCHGMVNYRKDNGTNVTTSC